MARCNQEGHDKLRGGKERSPTGWYAAHKASALTGGGFQWYQAKGADNIRYVRLVRLEIGVK